MANEKDLKKLGVDDLDVDGGLKYVLEESRILEEDGALKNESIYIYFYGDNADTSKREGSSLVLPLLDDAGEFVNTSDPRFMSILNARIAYGKKVLGY